MYEALVDNDVIIAMARYDLMTEFDTIMRGKCKRPFRCCPLARFSLRFGKTPRWKAYPTQGAHDRAEAFVRSSKPIPNVPTDAALFAHLISTPGVDEGEAMLVDYACSTPDAIIITADQTATFKIATDPMLSAVATKLAKRVVHMECLFETLHNRYGIANVRSKVFADPGAHAGLTSLIGSNHSEPTARSNLSLRVQTLEADLLGMLITPF